MMFRYFAKNSGHLQGEASRFEAFHLAYGLPYGDCCQSMPKYDLYILCRNCGNFHDALTRITLDESFDVRRVSDIYPQGIPLEFYQAVAQIHCSATNEPVEHDKPDMMVLVAAGRW